MTRHQMPVRPRKPHSKAEYCRAGFEQITQRAAITKRYPNARLVWPMACGKVAYPDYGTAEAALRYIQVHCELGARMPVRSYACPDCDTWHLTSWLTYPAV